MNKDWMKKSRLSQEYIDGVNEFVNFAIGHGANPNKIRCPCVKCCHVKWINVDLLKEHLITNGISQGYTYWRWHGEEALDSSTPHDDTEEFHTDNTVEANRIGDMIDDLSNDFQDHPQILENLTDDANKPLYNGCTKFTRLSALLKLYHLKTLYGWTEKSFAAILKLFTEMLPEDNCLPRRSYEAKKILCSMGMSYERIHACPNDCILYRKEYKSLDKCPNPKCEAPRYKKNGAPSKVLWYFPIIPRFRRLFANPEDAKKLTWHADGRIKDNLLRHPTDSPQWKTIDTLHQEFGKEDRNLRLALSTNGMNPHGSLSSIHSTWPVVLAIYNLPPVLCMKRRYMMLSLLISGPKQPGNDIDIYLAPLIKDLKVMWQEGIDVYDAYRKENFLLRSMLFCTINDFPAYGNLSGYSVKGHYACPICLTNTCYQQLKHSSKIAYLGHRRFLPENHRYRKLRKAFYGQTEEEMAPLPLSGQQIFNLVKDIDVIFGKTERVESVDGWKKRSIFFELPYWKDLFVRHCLDVMHIEKNVCDSLIGTLLNVPGKSKDGIKARIDYEEMNIRGELHPVKDGKRTYLPPACYTLSRNEKEEFCNFLHDVKVPTGYSSNIRSLVSMKDLKLVGMKTHDCHILLQQMVPVAIRSILPKPVRFAITRFCLFFKKLCSKMDHLSELEKAGEIEFSGRVDLLSMALDKQEHPGRVRGVSQNLTITDYFGHASRGKSVLGSGVSEENVAAAQEIKKMEENLRHMQQQHIQSQTQSQAQINEMQNFIMVLLEKMRTDNPSLPTPQFTIHMPSEVSQEPAPTVTAAHTVTADPVVPEAPRPTEAPVVSEASESTNLFSSCPVFEPSPAPSPAVLATSGKLLEESVPCHLFSPSMNEKDKVEIGSVCLSTSGVILHHRPLQHGYVKVQVITPLQSEKPIPLPTSEARTVYEAVGQFVAWPAKLVLKTKASTHKVTQNLNAKRKFASDGTNIQFSSKRAVNPYTERVINFKWYHRAMVNTPRPITLSESIMGYEPTIMVGKLEVGQLLDQEEIGVAHVSFYIKYVWEKHCNNTEDMFGFLCPSLVSPGGSRKTVTDRQQYVANAIRGNIEMKMVFAPCNIGVHWVLMAINVKDDSVYYLDSLRDEIPSTIPSKVQDYFDMGLKMFWAQKGLKKPRTKTRWINVECPRSSRSVDCGYYVLRFMREIIEKRYTNSIPTQYYSRQHTMYSQEEIDEIRVEWLEYFSRTNND